MWPEPRHYAMLNYSRYVVRRLELATWIERPRPHRYYWMDFSLSGRYDPPAGPRPGMFAFGCDGSAPEYDGPLRVPCDPTLTDVYFLGNLI